jgi:G3E family GTPase
MSTIPIHVVTGFLGSGKTTLINALMTAGFCAGTVVIVNEFGEVGLDQDFIQTAADEILVLKNGCMCCVVREDLVATLRMIAASGKAERVVIETSGIADPLPILQTLRSDFAVRVRYHPGAVVCTVDARTPPFGAHAMAESQAQLSAADALVLTKTGLVDAEKADELRVLLAATNPDSVLLPASGMAIAEFLLGYEASAKPRFPADLGRRVASAVHTDGLASVAIRDAEPRSWPVFAAWLSNLLHLHGDRVLRTKAILFDRTRDTWIGVHGVRRFLHPPVHLAFETAPDGADCIVFIVAGMDTARLEQSYRRHVARPVATSLPAPTPQLAVH